MIYVLVFLLLILIGLIGAAIHVAGPMQGGADIDTQLRVAEYGHRTAVYGDPTKM